METPHATPPRVAPEDFVRIAQLCFALVLVLIAVGVGAAMLWFGPDAATQRTGLALIVMALALPMVMLFF
jgi:hypothetical protein